MSFLVEHAPPFASQMHSRRRPPKEETMHEHWKKAVNLSSEKMKRQLVSTLMDTGLTLTMPHGRFPLWQLLRQYPEVAQSADNTVWCSHPGVIK